MLNCLEFIVGAQNVKVFSSFLCFCLGLGGRWWMLVKLHSIQKRRATTNNTMSVRGGGNLNRTYMKQHRKFCKIFRKTWEQKILWMHPIHPTKLVFTSSTALQPCREFIEFKLFYVCCALSSFAVLVVTWHGPMRFSTFEVFQGELFPLSCQAEESQHVSTFLTDPPRLVHGLII